MSDIKCEVCLLDSATDSVMWSCIGCTRKFHAACVGVIVQRNSLRKKDRKAIDVTSYVLPCCGSCQNLVSASFEFNVLVQQQAQLADQINKNTEVTHRSTVHQNNVGIVHEAIDRLEVLLIDIKKQLTLTGGSSGFGNVNAIKNHITSLFDISMQSTSEKLSSLMQPMMSDLKCLNDEVQQISSSTLDIVSNYQMTNNPMIGLDILDELKSVSAGINAIESKIKSTSPDSVDSLEYEINSINSINNAQPIVQSGWRVLGTRKVWKADWTEYDKRRSHRSYQEKQAEKARKRKKQARNNNNNNTHPAHHNRRYDDNFNLNHQHEFNQNYVNNRYIDHNNNCSHDGGRNGNSALPPDRVLLAAAKERFSKPQHWHAFDAAATHRPIQFQRGEVLNPYPVPDEFSRPSFGQHNPIGHSSNMATSCEACSAQHSCFRRN